MKSLMQSFLLVIGDDRAILLPPRDFPKASPLWIEDHTKENAEDLLKTLSMAPKTPVVILADILAQDYKREPFPHLSIFDKEKLLARRLQASFPNAELKTAMDSGENEALFITVDSKGPLGFWLDLLRPLPNPSGTLSLLPMESAPLLACLLPAAQKDWGLLISRQEAGGFRQIVTHNGKMIFTRLTPPLPQEASADTIAETLSQDIKATRDYLARQGMEKDAPLHLVALLPTKLHKAFASQKIKTESQMLFSPREAAAKLGLVMPPQPGETAADLVHALWFQTRKKRITNLIRPKEEAELKTKTLFSTGLMAASLFGFLSLAVLAHEAYSLYSLVQSNNTLRQNIQTLETTLQRSRQHLAEEAAPLEHLRQAVERRRLFSIPVLSPEPLLKQVTDIIGPEVRAVGLVWKDGELKLDLVLKEDGLKNNINELMREKIIRGFDNVAFILRGSLKDFEIKIDKYPYERKNKKVLSNKKKRSSRNRPPVARLIIRKEGS